MGLGQTLAKLRGKRGFTQAQLAAEAGVDASTISRVECGKYVPQQRTLQKLEVALGVKALTLVIIANHEISEPQPREAVS